MFESALVIEVVLVSQLVEFLLISPWIRLAAEPVKLALQNCALNCASYWEGQGWVAGKGQAIGVLEFWQAKICELAYEEPVDWLTI